MDLGPIELYHRILWQELDIDLATKRYSMNKSFKVFEISSKNLENRELLIYHPLNNGHLKGPGG